MKHALEVRIMPYMISFLLKESGESQRYVSSFRNQ